MPERMDVVFFGSGAFGLPTLRALAEAHTIRGVVTQPDRPAGRGRHLTPNPVAAWAAEHLPAADLIKAERANDPTTIDRIRRLPADAWVVIAFGQKLGPALLADRFAVNLHASLLPRWRGAAPINHAILGGDAETGNSVITLADRMDAGLVLAQSRRTIGDDQTAGQLHDALADDGPSLVLDVLGRHAAGTLRGEPQDESAVTLAPKLSKANTGVDWSRPARVVARRINGLSPWPGATSGLDGLTLRLLRARPSGGAGSAEGAGRPGYGAGRILDPALGLVQAGDGPVQILEVQPPNKPVMAWKDFANGHNLHRERDPAALPAFETDA